MFKSFSDFRYIDPFRGYSRSKWKVVKNLAEFCTIFCCHKFLGTSLVKIVPTLSPLPPGTSTEKRPVGTGDTPTSPEVTDSSTLNFRPHFKFSRLKFIVYTPVPAGVR